MKKNIIYNILLTVSQLLFPLITFPYVSRILGPENLGAISFAQSYSQYFILFAAMGIGIYGMREIAIHKEDKNRRSTIFMNIFSVHAIATLCLTVIYVGSIFIFSRFQEFQLLFLLSILHILLNVFSIEWFYQGMENFKYITLRSLVIRSLFVISIFLLVKKESDFLIYFALLLSSALIPFVMNIIYSTKFIDFTFRNVTKSSLVDTFNNLKDCSYYVVLTALYSTFPIVFLGFLSTEIAVGNYSVADKLYKLTISLFTAISVVMMPRMSHLYANGGKDGMKLMLEKLISYIFPLACLISLFVFLSSKDIILIFAGAKFETANLALSILSPLIIILPLAQLFIVQILLPMKKEKEVLKFSLISCLTGLVLNVILVPKFSLIGTSIGVLISEIIMTLFAGRLVVKLLGKISIVKLVYFDALWALLVIFLGYYIMYFLVETYFLKVIFLGIITFSCACVIFFKRYLKNI